MISIIASVIVIMFIYIIVVIDMAHTAVQLFGRATMTGWRNAVEIVLLEISNSMKPYASVFHAYTSELRPDILVEASNNSMSFPTVFRQPLTGAKPAQVRRGGVGSGGGRSQPGHVTPDPRRGSLRHLRSALLLRLAPLGFVGVVGLSLL